MDKEPVNTPITMVSNARNKMLIIGALLVAIFIIVVTVVLIMESPDKGTQRSTNSNSSDSSTSKPDFNKASNTPTTNANNNGPSGSIADNRKKVVELNNKILNSVSKLYSNKKEKEALFKELQNGNEKALPADFTSQFRWADHFKKDAKLRIAGYLSVIEIADTIKEADPTKSEINILLPGAEENVYMDLAAGQAFVPMTLYLGPKAVFSFEYVWVSGEWQLVPYGLIDQINTINAVSKNNSAAKPTPSK